MGAPLATQISLLSFVCLPTQELDEQTPVDRGSDVVYQRSPVDLSRIPSINSQRCGDEQYHSGLDSSLRFLALVAGFRSLGVWARVLLDTRFRRRGFRIR
ncbi:hypothetical protein SISNIDRAFT_67523 [Sistotremastrum niveocremeum HHB9708]|uniref:Secreted protein n=1 Tax=Sistotremastrum niveocremeum HHB9708 TaxID=1314777 RepID=A0A164V1P5_9AGAM|nr:hypothetical protein SISNIDRAFT_67523 [Sistotremastrum niveocremeum HHB9708]